MKTIEIFFHDLNDDAKKRYIEIFGDDDNRDLNPIAICDCEDESTLFEGTVNVLLHTVSFNYEITATMFKDTTNLKEMLKEEAEEHAKSQIIEGYVEGELNFEDPLGSAIGWWKINKE